MQNELQILAAVVDELAAVNAQIKALNDKAAELKEILIASNLPAVDGLAYKAAIKFVEPKPAFDYKAALESIAGDMLPKLLKLKKFQKAKAPYYAVSLFDL